MTCETCQRWDERIQLARDSGDEQKANMLRKLWDAHKQAEHRALTSNHYQHMTREQMRELYGKLGEP